MTKPHQVRGARTSDAEIKGLERYKKARASVESERMKLEALRQHVPLTPQWFEFRRKLLEKAPRHRVVLELAAEKAGWGKPLPAGQTRGIAVVESFGSFVAEVAEVSFNKNSGDIRVHRVVCAVDCGRQVNTDTIAAQMESGIVYGLTAALKGQITIAKGRVEQGNFNDYEMLRINEMPTVEVHIVPSNEAPGGCGEPGTPPIAPAVCNAIFAATGKPIRRLPISKEDLA